MAGCFSSQGILTMQRQWWRWTAASGEVIWRFSSETPVSENLALAGKTLIVGNQAGAVYGLDASSGVVDWQLSLGFPVSAVGVADENSLLITSEDGIVHRIR